MSILKNEDFLKKTEDSFRSLFNAAKEKNELHFAMALMPEFRGAQDAGWNTAEEANRSFDEYLYFIQNPKSGPIRFRVAISFYSHLSEASGFYEIPKNMLRIAGGETYLCWPFLDLVEPHRLTGEKIAPNANN